MGGKEEEMGTGTGTGHAGLKGNEIKSAKMTPFLMY